jgi:chromosome condensin MukBEF MukE localization factor
MEDILNSFKHVYVKEVVREPKMFFYRVPRLRSFMAIPLVYQSCLFEEALDNAVTDYLQLKVLNDEQAKAI